MDKWLNNSNAIRVISVALALVIWAIVHLDSSDSPQLVTSNTDTKIIEAVPIKPVGLDTEQYILTAMEATVARLVVEGKISSLFTAKNEDYIVELDLSNVKEGIQELPLRVTLPNGVTEVELSPRYMMVQIEKLETRTIEVEILTTGKPADGYIIGESTFTSELGNVVEITMPEDEFSRLDKVAVTVDVTEANSTIENKRSKIVAIDSQGNLIDNATFNPETLNVKTEITLPSKEVPVQLRYTGQLSSDLSVSTISTSVQTVKVFARQEHLDTIEVFDGAVVDLSKVTQSGEFTVKLSQVEGVAKVEPQEIPVMVEVEESQQRILEAVPITVVGLAEGYKINIVEAVDLKLDVPIKGAAQTISRVRTSDIVLTLDVTGLELGKHEVSLTAELPAYIVTNISDEFSYTMNVELIDENAINADIDGESIEVFDPENEEEGQLPSPDSEE